MTHNPYAHTPVPPPETPEDQRKVDYESAIGPNTGYYLKYFEDFDAGETKAGWHWPAFFVTTLWFVYRKMWLPGMLNLFWPLISLIVGAILIAVLGVTAGIVLCLLLLAAPSILLPLFAKAIYWRHVHTLVERLPPSVAASPEKRAARLEREGGTSIGAVAGVAAAGLFVYIFMLGTLAAIAIPAYQDYTIRAQVTEGLNMATDVKWQVEDHWRQHGQWPHQSDFGEQMPSGRYVQSVGVAAGSVVIIYGNEAHEVLSRHRVILLPGVMPDGEVAWACGNASLPDGAVSAGGVAGSDLANKYLPASCRGL
jgi:type IV pilus assembly protein PilA